MEPCSNLDPSLFLLLLLLPPSLALQDVVSSTQPQVPCFFIFGDSLVDNGNNNRRNITAKANYAPYGIDFPAGPTGRFNNGRNMADIIAELLGLDSYIPPFADAEGKDILRGFNYGSGGSGILDETGRHLGEVISLKEQLSNHEVVVSWIAELLGSENAAKEHLSKCVYLVETGNNDYLSNYFPKFYSSDTPYTPQQFAALLTDHYSNKLRKLYNSGARKVAVSAVGRLGCVPQALAVYGSFLKGTEACIETSNAITQFFDERLQLLINDLNNHFPSAKFIYTSGISANSSYGNISILSAPCCRVTETGGCIAGSVPCSNRDQHMFWDGYHPTEAANMIFAQKAYEDMSSLYAANPVYIM